MIRFLGTIAFLIILFAVVGYFRGWFMIRSTGDGARTHIEVTVDKAALHQDEARAQAKAREVTKRSADRISKAADTPMPEATPAR